MSRLVKKFFKNERFLNLLLRAITIAAKFLLSIIIVKRLSVSDLGVFGIIQTTITLLIYVLGFDFYTYNAREILKENRKKLADCIGNQLIFHSIVYFVVLPFTLLLFFYNVIDNKFLLVFYLVLVVEHLSQEVYRILIVLKKSVVSSLVLFIRSGSWIFVLATLWFFEIKEATLYSVLLFWFFAALVSIYIGLRRIPSIKRFTVDMKWIKNGVLIAFPFFLATVFYKLMEFSGRYFLDYYATKEAVGVFTFFSSISNAVFVFVHATVIIVMSPYLIEAARKPISEFRLTMQKFKRQIFLNTIIASFIGGILIYPFLYILNNEVLLANVLVFIFLMIATVLFCFSYIPHYKLYVFDKDYSLLISSIIGAITNIILNFVLVPSNGILGASIAQIGGMLALLLSKYCFSRKIS